MVFAMISCCSVQISNSNHPFLLQFSTPCFPQKTFQACESRPTLAFRSMRTKTFSSEGFFLRRQQRPMWNFFFLMVQPGESESTNRSVAYCWLCSRNCTEIVRSECSVVEFFRLKVMESMCNDCRGILGDCYQWHPAR